MSGDSTYPVAIDIGSSAVKLVKLEKRDERLFLSRLGAVSLAPGAVRGGFVRDPEEVKRALEILLPAGEGEEKKVIVALSGKAAMLRTVLLHAEEDFPVIDALEAEAMQVLPVPLDEVRLSHLRIGEFEKHGMRVDEYLMIAVRRKPLEELLDFLKSINYEPVIVDVNLLALESAFELSGMRETGETVALVDVGASETLVTVLRDEHILITRAIQFGGARVTRALANRLSIPLKEAEAVKLGKAPSPDPKAVAETIHAEVDKLAFELGRTLRLIWRISPAPHVDRVVLSGGGAFLTGLPARLATALDVPVKILKPFRHVEVPDERFAPHFVESLAPIAAIGAGLAYRAVESA